VSSLLDLKNIYILTSDKIYFEKKKKKKDDAQVKTLSFYLANGFSRFLNKLKIILVANR